MTHFHVMSQSYLAYLCFPNHVIIFYFISRLLWLIPTKGRLRSRRKKLPVFTAGRNFQLIVVLNCMKGNAQKSDLNLYYVMNVFLNRWLQSLIFIKLNMCSVLLGKETFSSVFFSRSAYFIGWSREFYRKEGGWTFKIELFCYWLDM